MINIILNLLLGGFAVFVTAYLLPGVEVDGFLTAVIVAIVLGLVNAILKPVLLILTLPINMVTLGLFTFIINALMVLLVDALIPGFSVTNILWALVFGLVLSLINSLFHALGR